jgi:hypothetical protein
MSKHSRPSMKGSGGGGYGSRVVCEKPVKVGRSAKGVSPGGVSQIGSALGNKSTERPQLLTKSVIDIYGGPGPAGGNVILGNQKALDVVGKAGPGSGRTLYGQSGSQQQWGKANPGNPMPGRGKDILSEFGSESSGANARRK